MKGFIDYVRIIYNVCTIYTSLSRRGKTSRKKTAVDDLLTLGENKDIYSGDCSLDSALNNVECTGISGNIESMKQ